LKKQLYRTACPRNCYSTCSFKVWVKDNKAIRIEPEPLNKSTGEGVCLKGQAYIERANSADRIRHPLIKQDGKFRRTTWENALNVISEKLIRYKNDFGSQSVFFYSASGSSGLTNQISAIFWQLFGGVSTVHGNLCWPAGLEATRLTLGENKHNVTWDIQHAELILLWGKNPAETNIHQMVPIQKALDNGAKLVIIDPRRTDSSINAHLLVQPKPGTDGLLALAIAKILIENDQIDNDFIDGHVRGYLQFKDSLKSIELSRVVSETGVSLEIIKKLSFWVGTIKPMTLVMGYGMQRFSNGGQTTRCLLSLSILTGNIGKKGACWHYADLQSDIFSAIKEPESYYPENIHPLNRSVSTAKLGSEMERLDDPRLKMIWVERGNPVSQNPESQIILQAFQKLDFRVVVDQFLTDTAMEADIVLPAKNMFEQSDIITSYWNPYIQFKPKIIEAPEDIKTEIEIYRLLAKKIGIPGELIRSNIPDHSDTSILNWLEDQLNKNKGPGLDKLRAGPQIARGLQEVAFHDYAFDTASTIAIPGASRSIELFFQI